MIIITTKKAKEGQTRVNINGSFGFKSVTDLYIDGILKVLDHDINRLGVVLDEMAAIAGDSVKVTVTVSADEAALPHDVKKYL